MGGGGGALLYVYKGARFIIGPPFMNVYKWGMGEGSFHYEWGGELFINMGLS